MDWMCVLLAVAAAFEFQLEPQTEECFGEHIVEDTLLVGKVASHDSESLRLRVLDFEQEPLIVKEAFSHLPFSFVALETGIYSICVWNGEQKTLEVTLDIKMGVQARDYSHIASTEDLPEFKFKLKKAGEQTKQIHAKIQFLREREEEMRATNVTIHQRIIGYSVSTIVLLLALVFLQTIYLKRFFKAKKMI